MYSRDSRFSPFRVLDSRGIPASPHSEFSILAEFPLLPIPSSRFSRNSRFSPFRVLDSRGFPLLPIPSSRFSGIPASPHSEFSILGDSRFSPFRVLDSRGIPTAHSCAIPTCGHVGDETNLVQPLRDRHLSTPQIQLHLSIIIYTI